MIQTGPENIERIREELRKMSDAELLRHGQGLRHMCSAKVNFGKPPLEAWATQLNEARAEWRRRHPKIPLSDSV